MQPMPRHGAMMMTNNSNGSMRMNTSSSIILKPLTTSYILDQSSMINTTQYYAPENTDYDYQQYSSSMIRHTPQQMVPLMPATVQMFKQTV